MADRRSGTVAITGAGSGIGLAGALHYARQGWQVGLIGRGHAALEGAARQVREAGGKAHAAGADVSDPAALELAAASVETAFGPIDVWINNAGIGFYGEFVDIPEDEFRRVIEVNLLGSVNGTRVALRRMRARDRGTVVQVLSAISFRGVPLQSAYSASKFGLRGFTEAVRAELRHERSRVHLTMVHPSATNTPFYSHAGSIMEKAPRPPPPAYQPELVGEALFLAGTVKRRDWVVGEQSAGLKLASQIAPGLLDVLMGIAGVAPQQTSREEVVERRRPQPVEAGPTEPRTHGPFDRESLPVSLHWLATKSPATAGLALGLAALGLAGALRRKLPQDALEPVRMLANARLRDHGSATSGTTFRTALSSLSPK